MATVAEVLALALQYHQAGNLQQAEQLYRQILQTEPAHADALHLLGVLAHQVGRQDLAITYIGQALGLKPREAAFHSDLGNAYQALGRAAEAMACYRQALFLQPAYPEAHYNLANSLLAEARWAEAVASYREALRLRPSLVEAQHNLGFAYQRLGRPEEAEACYREALRLRPALAEAHSNLGTVLQAQGRLEEAELCLREALRLRPSYADAYCNLGGVLLSRGRPGEAEACFQQALRLKPDSPEAHYSLATLLEEQQRWGEAEAGYREALRLRPSYADAHNNLGNILQALDRLPEAEACYRQALRLRPDYAGVHNNLGNVLKDQGRLGEAEASYGEAVRLQPDFAEAHYNRSLVWLLRGDWRQGWPEYEWRWRWKETPPRPFQQPLWDGSPLGGRTILLHAEQGLGDTLQFARYAPLVKQRGGVVLLGCHSALLPLLRSCPGIDGLVAEGRPPDFDVHAPLLSLPRILGTTLDTIPAAVPYLSAEPARVERWRQELVGGLKVGIAWQGSRRHKHDRQRSVPLARFAPLAEVEGVRLYSLQVGPGRDQLAESGFPITDLASRLEDFGDTAAVVKNLDLVLTVDTALAHCAGALGVPVWVALPFAPDWRWLVDREDSPWYPTMRLFRQRQPGDWEDVFQRMGLALAQVAASRTP